MFTRFVPREASLNKRDNDMTLSGGSIRDLKLSSYVTAALNFIFQIKSLYLSGTYWIGGIDGSFTSGT